MEIYNIINDGVSEVDEDDELPFEDLSYFKYACGQKFF